MGGDDAGQNVADVKHAHVGFGFCIVYGCAHDVFGPEDLRCFQRGHFGIDDDDGLFF